MLSRQVYRVIAEVFKHNLEQDWSSDLVRFQEIVEDLADYFKKDDPRFNRVKFLKECGL